MAFGKKKRTTEVDAAAFGNQGAKGRSAADDLSNKKTFAGSQGVVRYPVDKSYIWLGSLRAFLMAAFVIILSSASSIIGPIMSGELAEDGIEEYAGVIGWSTVGFIVLLIVICVVLHVLAYKNIFYELGPEELATFSGILVKKQAHVPYHRIQSVDQKASLLQRMAGVCSVYIDTAGGSSNKAIIVPYLKRNQAEFLRAELFARKQGRTLISVQGANPLSGNFGEQNSNVLDVGSEIWSQYQEAINVPEFYTGHVSYEFGLTNKELVFTGISNNTAFVVALVSIIAFILDAGSGMFFDADFAIQNVAHLFESIPLMAALSFTAALAASIIGAAIVIWVISALVTCVRFGGFKARRRDSRIEVEHGLLQHVFSGIDISRVQSVSVRQNFFRRLIGYCEIRVQKIDAAGKDDNGKNNTADTKGVIIHPFVKINRVDEILAGLLPEFPSVPVQHGWQWEEASDKTGARCIPLSPVAKRRAIFRNCIWFGFGFWLAVITAIAKFAISLSAPAEVVLWTGMVSQWIYSFCILLTIAMIVFAILWSRQSWFSYNRDFLTIVRGGYSVETCVIPRRKIQYARLRSNPFQRRVKTETLMVRTAAGVGGTTIKLIDVAENEACEWLNWAQPRVKPSA